MTKIMVGIVGAKQFEESFFNSIVHSTIVDRFLSSVDQFSVTFILVVPVHIFRMPTHEFIVVEFHGRVAILFSAPSALGRVP